MSAVSVFVCCGCDRLEESSRSDVLTCSPACRTRAHRNGSIKTLRKLAARLDIPPAIIKQAEAIWRLRPDLADEIQAGKLTIQEAQQAVYHAFIELLMMEVRS